MFEIGYDNQPLRFLRKQDKILSDRVLNKINFLINNLVSHDAKRVEGFSEPVFRIRIGDYRVLYRINYDDKRIVIIKIDKRGRVYK